MITEIGTYNTDTGHTSSYFVGSKGILYLKTTLTMEDNHNVVIRKMIQINRSDIIFCSNIQDLEKTSFDIYIKIKYKARIESEIKT